MQRRERLSRLHEMLRTARVPVPRARLIEELACSESTVYRVIAELRDIQNAPIRFCTETQGYFYADADNSFELPGLWFTTEELFALLAAEQLLASVDPGLLGESLSRLQARLSQLLGTDRHFDVRNLRRIRILRMAGRAVENAAIQQLARAVLNREQLEFDYRARGSGETSLRRVCPQRLTHYRDNWYLDAWCHQRQALRTFAVDRVGQARILASTARDIDEASLDHELSGAYGIFSGQANLRAVLRFSAERARWVADEIWHPDQSARWLADGQYELTLPFNRSEELEMDILRHGEAVEVIEPADLRNRVAERHRRAARRYEE